MARNMKRPRTERKPRGPSDGDMPVEETTLPRSSSEVQICGTKKKKNKGKIIQSLVNRMDEIASQICSQGEMIQKLVNRTDELSKHLEKVTGSLEKVTERLEKLSEGQNDRRKQLELHINAPRSQWSQEQPPRYRLEFKSNMDAKIEKGKSLEIQVALVDCNSGQTVENGPLASATVELVVIDAKFNANNNLHNWSIEDFRRNIKKAGQGKSAAVNVDESEISIVSNGRFNLENGVKHHCDFSIFENSSNKRFRLGVMVVPTTTQERVLEGLSNPFFVRGHDRNRTQAQAGSGNQEQNGPMSNMQNPSYPNSTRADGNAQAWVGNGNQQQNGPMSNMQNSSYPNSTRADGNAQAWVGIGNQQQNRPMYSMQNPSYLNSTQADGSVQAWVGNRNQQQNGSLSNMQNPSYPNSTQAGGNVQARVGNGNQQQNGPMSNMKNPSYPNVTQAGVNVQAWFGNGNLEQNGPMSNMQNASCPNSTRADGNAQAWVGNGNQQQNRPNPSYSNSTQADGNARLGNGNQQQSGPNYIMQNPSYPNSAQAGGNAQAWVGNGNQEQNGLLSNMQIPSYPNSTKADGNARVGTGNQEQSGLLSIMQSPSYPNSTQADGNWLDTIGQTSASQVQQDGMGQLPDFFNHFGQTMNSGTGASFTTNQITFPVRLVLDMPSEVRSKHRFSLLDQLMPLHSWQAKNCGLPTVRLMQEHFGSLTTMPKEVMQTRRGRGVRIEPLEPDDSDEGRPLKRKRHSKYQLRFVNKARKTYYTRDQIKADDGNLLMVALFDENNTKITYGPLSSASVEVVALHGDFNVDGLDYWTSEEFRRSVVSPPPGEEASSVIGGDLILVLAGGEACLRDAFFKRTSFCARTEKFKMGVMLLASTQEQRVQEGISESFRVIDCGVEELPRRDGATTDKAPPPGFRFHPTDEELIVDYLCHRDAAKSFTAHVIAEVDIYKFDPWDLPAKAVYGDHEWYFFSPLKRYPNKDRPNRAAGSGYWKATGTDKPINNLSADGDDTTLKMLGFKKAFVFYKGRPPRGEKTNWIMHEYRLHNNATQLSSNKPASLDEWVLCRIFRKYGFQSSQEQVRRLDQQLPEFLSYTDLPPGFRFHPTDEELILDYLLRRAKGAPCRAPVIAEVDIYKFDPWELPSRAAYGEREWYFFCRTERKYPTGVRPNRAAGSGYWKATGTDKPINNLSADGDDTTLKTLGFKKTLVFYRGRAPMGMKTNWIMHEYRLHNNTTLSTSVPDVWVLCRLIEKMSHIPPEQQQIDHAAVPLPPLSTMPSTSSSVSECITNLTNTPSTPEQQQIDQHAAVPPKMEDFSHALLPALSTMPSSSSSVFECIRNLTNTPSTPEPPSCPRQGAEQMPLQIIRYSDVVTQIIPKFDY